MLLWGSYLPLRSLPVWWRALSARAPLLLQPAELHLPSTLSEQGSEFPQDLLFGLIMVDFLMMEKNVILSLREMEGERVLRRIWCWSGLVSIEMGGVSATGWNESGLRLVSESLTLVFSSVVMVYVLEVSKIIVWKSAPRRESGLEPRNQALEMDFSGGDVTEHCILQCIGAACSQYTDVSQEVQAKVVNFWLVGLNQAS